MKRIFVIVGCIVALALGCAGCSEQGGKVPSLDDPTPSSSCGGVGQDPCAAPCEEGQVLDSVDGNEVCVESCTGGKVPVDGICVCPEGSQLEDDKCVTAVVADSCPSPDMVKVDGKCVCPEGKVLVDNKCVTTEGCLEGQALVDGKCIIVPCNTAQVLVDGKCVDAPIKVCLGIGQIVVDGKCVCPTGKILKGNQCVVDEGLGGFQPIGPIGPITGICLLPLVKGLDGKCACPPGTVYDATTNTCNMIGGGAICLPGFVKNEAGECVKSVGVGGYNPVVLDSDFSGVKVPASKPFSVVPTKELATYPAAPPADRTEFKCPDGYAVGGNLKIYEDVAESYSSEKKRVTGFDVKCRSIHELARGKAVNAGAIYLGDANEYKIPEGFALAGWMVGSTKWDPKYYTPGSSVKTGNYTFATKVRPIAKRIDKSGVRDDVLWVGPEVTANEGGYSYSQENGVTHNNSLIMCRDGEVLSSVILFTEKIKAGHDNKYWTVGSISGQCVSVEGGSAIKPTGKAKVKLARGDDGKIAVKWKEVAMGERIDFTEWKEIQCAKNPIGDDEDMALSGIAMTLKKGSEQIRGVRVYCTNLEIMNRPSLEEFLLTDYADDLLPKGVTHYGKQEAQFSKSIPVMDKHDGDKTVIDNYIPLNFVATGVKIGSSGNRISAINMYAGLIDTALGLDQSWERSILSYKGSQNKDNGSAECGAGEVLTGVRLAFDNTDVLKGVYGISCAKVVPAD